LKRVVVGPREALAERRVALAGVNWLGPRAIEATNVAVKIRSTTSPKKAHLERGDGDKAELVLAEPEYGVAAGQAAVFYDGRRVLGGGWIQRKQK
jgi:tRNA-specific 2-thiouridylase